LKTLCFINREKKLSTFRKERHLLISTTLGIAVQPWNETIIGEEIYHTSTALMSFLLNR
jgi:hypothetical protein